MVGSSKRIVLGLECNNINLFCLIDNSIAIYISFASWLLTMALNYCAKHKLKYLLIGLIVNFTPSS